MHSTHGKPSITIDGDRLVTIEQHAVDEGVSSATVIRRVRRGELESRRVLGRLLIRVPVVTRAAR